MRGTRHFPTRPWLEALEDRALPASVSVTPGVVSNVQAQFARAPDPPAPATLPASSVNNLQAQFTSPSSPATSTGLEGELGALTTQAPEAGTGPAVLLASGGQSGGGGSPAGAVSGQAGEPLASALRSLSFLPDLNALGFSGRIEFPQTGVQVRTASVSGPLTQPPGVFLVGGSLGASEGAPAPRAAPPAGGAKEAEGKMSLRVVPEVGHTLPDDPEPAATVGDWLGSGETSRAPFARS